MIAEMAKQYGLPEHKQFHFSVTQSEFNRIRSSQKHDRNHDVTLYVRKGDKVIVIAKHFYPPGLYRAPSGGLQPGESFVEGINREIAEETGCAVALDRFILQTAVDFSHDNQNIFWRSFIFLADYIEGDFQFTDKHEIREVRLVDWSNFETYGHIMRQTDIGGLHYRAALHDSVIELI